MRFHMCEGIPMTAPIFSKTMIVIIIMVMAMITTVRTCIRIRSSTLRHFF